MGLMRIFGLHSKYANLINAGNDICDLAPIPSEQTYRTSLISV